MAWTVVTIPRRTSGVGMPERCVYCNGAAEQDMTLRTRREAGRSKGRMTTTRLEEHVAIDVPFCRTHAAQSTRLRTEIRRLGFVDAGLFGLIGLVLVLVGLDAPFGVRFVFGVLAGLVLAVLALLATAVLVRRVPRYRDWGAGLLGVDLAAGAEAFTFRFANPTYAAMFRTRNGGQR